MLCVHCCVQQCRWNGQAKTEGINANNEDVHADDALKQYYLYAQTTDVIYMAKELGLAERTAQDKWNGLGTYYTLCRHAFKRMQHTQPHECVMWEKAKTSHKSQSIFVHLLLHQPWPFHRLIQLALFECMRIFYIMTAIHNIYFQQKKKTKTE